MDACWSPVLEIEASSHSDFYNLWQSVHLRLVVCSRKTTDVALQKIGVTCLEDINLILPEEYLRLAGEHFRNLVDYLHGFGSRLLFKNLYSMGNPLRGQQTLCTACVRSL